MLNVSEADKRIIEETINQIIGNGCKKILIYPYGNIGRYAKELLQKKSEISILQGDNMCFGNGVLSKDEVIEALDKDNDLHVLFATMNPSFFEALEWKQYLDKKERLLFFTKSKRVEIQVKSILEKRKDSIKQRKIFDFAEYLKEKPVFLDDGLFAEHIRPAGAMDMIPGSRSKEVDYLKTERQVDYSDMVTFENEGWICRNPGNHVIPGYDRVLKRGLGYYHQVLTERGDERVALIEALQFRIRRFGEVAVNYHSLNAKRISEACNWISENPPRTFFEALQLLIILHASVVDEAGCGSISFGRLDQYLYPYYKDDLDANRLTNNQAQELLDVFWEKLSENEMTWQNITIGGRTPTGEDGCNELTLMALEATRKLHRDQPQLSLRDSGKMPKEVWNKAMEVIASGGGMPSIFCDDVAIAAKEHVGVTHEDALDYGVMGCVELCIGGKEYAHTEGLRLNLAKVLECFLQQYQEEMNAPDSFKEFLDNYFSFLEKTLQRICEFLDIAGDNYSRHWPVPFLSLFMDGCVESGKDVTAEGTVYNLSTICPTGFASAVDSLEAIRECVYEEKILDLSELNRRLQENHSDEKLRQRLLRCEKYGNDLDNVDAIAKQLTDCIQHTVDSYKGKYRKGAIQLGYYTSYFHSDFGKLTGATPDGRKAGEPLSPSYSAVSGMDKNGPLALMNSANCGDMKKFANGMALDIRFAKSFLAKEENREKLILAIKGYFTGGGQEIQVNCFDVKELEDAQRHPEKYQNLVVRVAGFSAYFVRLDETLQNEIMNRMENEGI